MGGAPVVAYGTSVLGMSVSSLFELRRLYAASVGGISSQRCVTTTIVIGSGMRSDFVVTLALDIVFQ